MTGTLPLLYSQSHHLDPQGLAGTQARAPLASLTGKEEKEALEEPCRQRPTWQAWHTPKTNVLYCQGQAAWLPCRLSLVPGLSPHAPAQTCGWPWSSGFHQELCILLFLILQVAVAQEQLGSQGEDMGQSWPLPMPAWQKHCQRELWRPETQ